MRFPLIVSSLVLTLTLLGCPAKPAEPAKTAATPPPASGDPAPTGDPAATLDPTAVIDQVLKPTDTTVSVHNSVGDRINIEAMNPLPAAMGQNEWGISFKADESKPLDMGDHLAIEISKQDAPADATPVQFNFNGGSSGGTLIWTADSEGTFLVRMSVKRHGEDTGPVVFHCVIGAAGTTTAPSDTGATPPPT
ncbi:MAG: hypothetical protein ABI743_06065 [bacterium]